jgi:hypothetical protein
MGNKYTDAQREAAKNRRDVEKKVGKKSLELEVLSLEL